ncbi:MAG: hypothetical protein ACI88A_001042 [Paraglaciecola sp.]|jgi:hypothetical protein
MDPIKLVAILTTVFSVSIALSWLDYKNGWHLLAWINGKSDNPFINQKNHQETQSSADKDQIIAQLSERIQILEKIVTEPAYELNKKLNQL